MIQDHVYLYVVHCTDVYSINIRDGGQLVLGWPCHLLLFRHVRHAELVLPMCQSRKRRTLLGTDTGAVAVANDCLQISYDCIWLYMIHRWCQSARLVPSGVPNCAEVMMGFIFGVERTLKLPLMISLRRPDRTRWIQDGPFIGDTLRLKLRLLRDWGYLILIYIYWDIFEIFETSRAPHFIFSYGIIWIYMALPNPFHPFLSRQTDNVIVFDDLLAMHHGWVTPCPSFDTICSQVLTVRIKIMRSLRSDQTVIVPRIALNRNRRGEAKFDKICSHHGLVMFGSALH